MAIYGGVRRYACLHCDSAEWWLTIFEDSNLDPLMRDQLEESGSRVEVRSGSSRTLGQGANDWQVTFKSQLPSGFSPISNGLAFKQAAGLTEIWVRGTLRPVSTQGQLIDCDTSPTGRRLVFLANEGNASSLTCIDGTHDPAFVRPPPGERILCPRFIDEVRFIFLRGTDQAMELFEGTFDVPGRIRSRRITQIGQLPSGPPRLAVSRRIDVIVVRQTGSQCEIIRVPIGYGSPQVVTTLASSPRQLVACVESGAVAWIDWHGEIRYLNSSDGPKLIGRTSDNLLALSRNGQQIAWLNSDRIEIADLNMGRFYHRSGSPEAFHLEWKGSTGGEGTDPR
jgi:hypothetical protein